MRTLLLTSSLIVLIGSGVAADDIGFISVKNGFQAQVVTSIVGHAYTKVDERFLASISAEQVQLLSQAGIEYEILMADAEPGSTYLIRPICRSDYGHVDPAKLGKVIDLGLGMKLARLSRFAAASLRGSAGLAVNALEEMNVRFHYIPTAVAGFLAALGDFPSDSLADRVSQDSIYAVNVRLEAFETRYIWTDSIDAARDWLVQKLLSWGYTDVSTPSFFWGGGWHYNVMAVKPGYAEPDKVIVVGGHYDSITYGEEPGPEYYAPGADDNGSGTATTMELARIFADVPFRKTIIFIPFSAEEVGLVGSRAAAREFVSSGTDIEVMFNFDMVGYTGGLDWELDLSSGPNTAYRQLTIDVASRVTDLIPVAGAMGGSSDHYSFQEQGFNVVNAIEGNFNFAGWHTNLDLTSRMDFPFLTDVVRMTVAAVAIVADAAHPTEIAEIIDLGDGQSLEVFWSDCDPTYNYMLCYGASSGVYTDTVTIPSGVCSWVVSGLSDGVTYYFSVVGDVPDGYPAVYSVEGSGTPYVVPRPPSGIVAEPDYLQITLDWEDNREADFAYYRIYRDDGLGFVLHEDNIMLSEHVDTDVQGHNYYLYRITAVDNDMNESDFSAEAGAYAATFDLGILLADETNADTPMPPQEVQEAFFDSILAGTPYTLELIEGADDPLERNIACQYSSLFWIDDDLNTKLIKQSEDSLDWYAGYATNILVAGFRTVRKWTTSTVNADHLLYREFGLSSVNENSAFDFVGAGGVGDWPSVTVDPSNPLGNLPFVPRFSPRPGATVIYTYDSFSDDPAYEGEPCGLLYISANGPRVLLGFPLYFLTEESARNLVLHVVTLFGEQVEYVAGDVDGSGEVDIDDLLYLAGYMFNLGPAPANINAADVNASCQVDISDLLYLVNHMFGSPAGPAPLPGCVY